jgi:hypothetical protein
LLCYRPECFTSTAVPSDVTACSVVGLLKDATNTNLVNTYVDRSIGINIKGIVKRRDEVLTVSKN